MRVTRKLRLLALTAGLMAAAAPAMAEDANAGGVDFKQRCQTCHTGQPNAPGPSLKGLIGRKAGSTAFNYSEALKGSGLTWTAANLDKFLTSPFKAVPGTRMLVSTPDAKRRADLIAYLATLK
jgi:cytochrome c